MTNFLNFRTKHRSVFVAEPEQFLAVSIIQRNDIPKIVNLAYDLKQAC